MSEAWDSLHIYYHADQDALLMACVEPLLAGANQCPVFFIRHWQGGPHIRLRCHARDVAGRAALRQSIRSFLDHHPSAATLDPLAYAGVEALFGELEGHAGEAGLQPDNTARPEAYVPEFGKYGGEHGVVIAEEVFCRSTRVALGAIRAAGGSTRRRLGLGFSMFLGAALGFGLKRDEIPAFAAAYERSWASVPGGDRGGWERLLAAHRPALRDAAERILCGGSSPLVAHWASVLATAARRLDEAADPVLGAMPFAMPREDKRRLLLMQYIHTHNNRMGIDVGHEAYLGFMVRSCLN